MKEMMTDPRLFPVDWLLCRQNCTNASWNRPNLWRRYRGGRSACPLCPPSHHWRNCATVSFYSFSDKEFKKRKRICCPFFNPVPLTALCHRPSPHPWQVCGGRGRIWRSFGTVSSWLQHQVCRTSALWWEPGDIWRFGSHVWSTKTV